MSLLSNSQKTSVLAPALPIRNTVFEKLRLYLRQGQFTILGSAPSVGKSIFARNLVVNAGVNSLFFSADSDEYTVKVSVAAALTKKPLAEVEGEMEEGRFDDYYQSVLSRADHVQWSFRADINIDLITDYIAAYSEPYGDYPKLVVIDNLGDMTTASGTEKYAELSEICRELRSIARNTHSHILGLAHLTGEYEDGMKPVTLKALEGKLGKIPENVLGLNWSDTSQQRVDLTVPKARGTKRGMTVPIQLDYSRALIGDFY